MGLNTDAPAVLALVDGGVYDNLGLEWFQGWSAGRPAHALPAEFRIVVDASGPLKRLMQPRSTAGSLLRVKDIQYAQTRSVRTRWFVEHLIDGVEHGLYLSISRHPSQIVLPSGQHLDPGTYEGALPQEFAPALGRVRTDFDKFSAEEIDLLEYHGYWSAHALLTGVRPALATEGQPQWRDYAGLSAQERSRLLRLLALAPRHFGRGSVFR
jgi:hypothetical protein